MQLNPNLYSIVGAGINSTEQVVQTAIKQLSSGVRVASAADGPAAAAANALSLAASANVDRYTKNSDAVLAKNHMADSILNNVVSTLTQAVSLGTQGAIGSINAQNRSAIATQVQALLQQVVSDANQKYNGSSLFAGTPLTGSCAFIADSASPIGYTYQGDSGINQVPIGDGIQVANGVPSDQIFISSSGNVIGSLSQLVTALNTGTVSQIADATAAVSAAINHVGQQRAMYAGVATQIQSRESYLSQETVSLSSQQQRLTGVDITTAIEQLTQAQTAHTAVLAAAAKILPISLLNYLNPAG